MIIDTHAHLNYFEFDSDREELIQKCLDKGYKIINVGTNIESSEKCIEISSLFKEGVFSAVGLHPSNIVSSLKGSFEKREDFFDYDYYKKLANFSKVVAIGEIGLDYWYRPKGKNKRIDFISKQKEIFQKQIDLAKELNLPIIIHCRSAFEDLIEILSSRKTRGVIHCFTGTKEEAKKLLDLGYYLGFNGIIFKVDLLEVLKMIPIERVLLETDCPYLSPPNFEERNNPLSLSIIVEEISKIKNISPEFIMEKTTLNAEKLFKI